MMMGRRGASLRPNLPKASSTVLISPASTSASKTDHLLKMDAIRTESMLDRKTKIVCTIGPRSASRSSVNALLHAGMNVLRLNCSHGDHEFYRDVIVTWKTA